MGGNSSDYIHQVVIGWGSLSQGHGVPGGKTLPYIVFLVCVCVGGQ